MIVAGIDIGSKSVNAVVIDDGRRILGTAAVRTRADFPSVAQEALDKALVSAGIQSDAVDYVATTGFGRYNIPFRDLQITEATCVARGAAFLFPETDSVLDIGAQSTRAVRLADGGRVREFKSNDKCAAGGGAFLERAARYLEVQLEDLGELSLHADEAQMISSVCAVLAESEIINHVSTGQSVENILYGVHLSLATRAQTLLSRVRMEGPLTFVGGVARQEGMVKALSSVVGTTVNVPDEPDTVAALGAALLGLQRLHKRLESAPVKEEALT